ncbi:Crp/Fnr family transcriptional regulator [Rhodoblastus sphagnicola]|uniref:Crp/Fnr family transcriptional regulator n=1 Tax=Rhodoblastus sphagnicola TaxID=333368 RepID=A0A2S6N820_9HYPH|nr:cyclic nucleotide-binding domain-containing protein [Rhodoblastus sphagnicola]MBB4197873.1 hypothetical protein [Rhodoblastus sphagnicola]PPQ30760.1 Crp/Fnr family transcriptional regulator [Rhodoblastus sphagnicola]
MSSENLLYLLIALAWLQTIAAIVSTVSKTMIRLRVASVLSNLFGLIVSVCSANPATLIRHIIILPIDLLRLREMRKLVASVKIAANTDLNVEWLKPFMHPVRLSQGAYVFRKGDVADNAFMLIEGAVEAPEIGRVLKPGDLFGEMAMFTAEGRRTASALCRTDVRLLAITYEQFEQLYFQNPEFGLYLVRLIVSRYQANLAQLESVETVGAPPPPAPRAGGGAEAS